MKEMKNGHNPVPVHRPLSNKAQVNWDDCLPIPKVQFPLAAVLVCLFSTLCFFNSLDGEFVFDDSEAIIGNKDLSPGSPLGQLFVHDFWGRKLDSNTSHKSYRPITVLTFRWNFYLAGGLHPQGFHAVNIFLHGVVCVLFLRVFSLLLSVADTKQAFSAPKASLLCALLFAIHPVHTESVAGIVGRADLLCALFVLCSFLCYVHACYYNFSDGSSTPTEFSFFWIFISMVLAAISVFSKEQGITVLGICSAFDIVVICRIDISQLLLLKNESKHKSNGLNKKSKDKPTWIKPLVFRHLILLMTGITLLVVRWKVMGSTPPTFQVFDNPHSFVNGAFMKFFNYSYLYAINSWLLINPSWLCFDWSMGCIPTITSFADLRIIVCLLFWAVLASLFYTCFKSPFNNDRRVLIMSLVIIIVTFLPASNIFFRVGFVVAERVLYLPSSGFCLLVVMGLRKLCRAIQKPQIMKVFITFLILVFIARSMHRSHEWRKEWLLFSSGEKVCPLNAKVHYNIAKLQADMGNTSQAISKYRLAIKLNPKYDQAMNNLANLLKDGGNILEAEELLLKAIQLRPSFAAAWMNLGIVQSSLKKYHFAERSYITAIQHRHNYPDCFYNLGNLYLETQLHEQAITAWMNATQLKPTHFSSWNNIAILLDNLNQMERAEKVCRDALKILPMEPQLHSQLASILGKLEKYEESEQEFRQAITLDPKNSRYLLNLGILYHRWGKFRQAETAYKNALALDPALASAKKNLQMLYQKFAQSFQS